MWFPLGVDNTSEKLWLEKTDPMVSRVPVVSSVSNSPLTHVHVCGPEQGLTSVKDRNRCFDPEQNILRLPLTLDICLLYSWDGAPRTVV